MIIALGDDRENEFATHVTLWALINDKDSYIKREVIELDEKVFETPTVHSEYIGEEIGIIYYFDETGVLLQT